MQLPQRKTRKQIVVSTLIFNALTIIFVLGWGETDNSLHSSSLSWAYSSSIAVIMGYVFGAVADNYNVFKNQDSDK